MKTCGQQAPASRCHGAPTSAHPQAAAAPRGGNCGSRMYNEDIQITSLSFLFNQVPALYCKWLSWFM